MNPVPRWRRLAAVGTLMVLTLTACVPASGGTTTELPPGGGLGTAEEPVQVRVLANDAFARIWQQDLVPEFRKQYPHVQVTVDGLPYADLLPKTVLELTGDSSTYDVVTADDNWLPQLAGTGNLVDLKRELDVDPAYDWDDFTPAALAAGEWEGTQYGVPTRANLLLLTYNKELFRAAGVPLPDQDWTWEEFWAAAEQLMRDTNGDGSPDTWAISTYFTRDALTPTIWQTVLDSNGGQLLDDRFRPAFDNARGVAALEAQLRMVKHAPPGAETYGFNETIESFRQQKVAMMINWGSVYQSVAADPEQTSLTPEQVGITTLPAGSCCRAAHRGVWTTAIPRASEHRDAAWAFLQWMTSKEGEQIATEKIGQFPSRTSTLQGTPPEPWLEQVFDASLAGFEVAREGEMWRPRLPESDAIQQVLATQTSRAVTGQATPEEALSTAAAEIEELLERTGRLR